MKEKNIVLFQICLQLHSISKFHKNIQSMQFNDEMDRITVNYYDSDKSYILKRQQNHSAKVILMFY